MKRLVTCLEEKRILVFALMSLAALTVLAAVSIYQIRTAGTKEEVSASVPADGSAEDSDQNNVAAQQDGTAQQNDSLTDGSNGGQDVADANIPQENGFSDEEVPNAQEIGNQTLVNEGTQAPVPAEESVAVAADPVAAMNLTYDGTYKLSWPVAGREILRDYSMDSTVYYATLNQYKVSKGILIQEQPGSAVMAPANGLVTEVGTNEEIGNYVVLRLGENYSMLLGNLTEPAVSENQYILQGTVLGQLAEPTKYYSVEGPSLYLELRNGDEPVDPIAYLD